MIKTRAMIEIENNKNQKKKEVEIDDKKKKPSISFMQVDKGGSVISNFISNFIRQFNNQKGHNLGLLKGLWQPKGQQSEKQAQPSNIIGSIQDNAKLAKERRERCQTLQKIPLRKVI